MDLTELDGIGPVRAESLNAMGIFSLRDLLFTLPIRYEDHITVYPCNTRKEGSVLVSGTIISPPKLSVYHGLRKVTTTIQDPSGKMPVCWYNEPWMMQNIHSGEFISLFGRLVISGQRRTLQNPKIVRAGEGLIPVYRSVKGFPAKSFRNLVQNALQKVDDCCPETLPIAFRLRHRLCELNYAIREAHFPDSQHALEIARRRLAFERLLMYMVFISFSNARKQPGFPFSVQKEKVHEYWNSLPFQPTEAQRRVLDEIAEDLKKDVSMSRLVQGDVGCGKTAVAFGSLYLAASAGFQACMMAPTEILATQHYRSAMEILKPFGIRCRLLTGSTRAKERREILSELKENRCDVLFGTHALISNDVEYGKLGLVITDEQHRFGVNQRSRLQQKGQDSINMPHVLVLSATPIPRTLALILYGDLDLSVIDELPKGRIPVKTRLVPEARREDMYQFLRGEVEKGRQAYIVCPLVQDSDDQNDLQSAKTLFSHLQNKELKGLRIALTWGSQKAEDKNRVLKSFTDGEFDVLVSTTVIEVGVNNPNATIMIIENAERYGLSQLHQLRGRVGRGSSESWCFLVSDGSDKLKVLCSTNDGFAVSQKDLELRGPGDILGTKQSGEAEAGYLFGDIRLLDEVVRCVHELYEDPEQKESRAVIEEAAVQFFQKNGFIAMN